MSLIKCPDCGKEISDKVEKCMYCGYPFELHEKEELKDKQDVEPLEGSSVVQQKATKKKGVLLLSAVISIITVLILIVFFVNRCNEVTVQQFKSITENNSIPDKGDNQLIWNHDNIEVVLEEANYTDNASDVQIVLSVKNNSDKFLNLNITDVKLDDAFLRLFNEKGADIQAGASYSCNYYISLEDVKSAGATSFQNMTCKVIATSQEGEEIFSKDLSIERNNFINASERDNNSNQIVEESTQCIISQKNRTPVIYSKDGFYVAMDNLQYIENESDVVMTYKLNNYTDQIVMVELQDMQVDGKQMNFSDYDGSRECKAGVAGSACFYIPLENLQNIDAISFSEISFKIVAYPKEGTPFLSREISITRDSFVAER